MRTQYYNTLVNQGLKRDIDLPVSLPAGSGGDIYSTVKEPDTPTMASSGSEEEDNTYNQWENNYN